MKKIVLSLMFVMVATNIFAEEWKPASWPVMKHYDSAHLYQIALPLGGIGTGQVSLGGRGELRDWEIMNIPAKGFSTVYEGSSNAPFFAIYVKPEGGKSSTTLLEGPLYDQELLGGGGIITACHDSKVHRSMLHTHLGRLTCRTRQSR